MIYLLKYESLGLNELVILSETIMQNTYVTFDFSTCFRPLAIYKARFDQGRKDLESLKERHRKLKDTCQKVASWKIHVRRLCRERGVWGTPPGRHYCDYYPGTQPCSQVSATHLKIGHPEVKSIKYRAQ